MKTVLLVFCVMVLGTVSLNAQIGQMTDEEYRTSLVKLWEEDEEVLIPPTTEHLDLNNMILESPVIISSDGFILDDSILPLEALKRALLSARPKDETSTHYWIAIEQESGARADEIIDLMVYLRSIRVTYKVIR